MSGVYAVFWREMAIFKMTFEEFQTAPISSLSVVLGEVLSGVVKGILASSVIFFLALAFGVNLKINGGFLLSLFLNTFMFASAGVVASMVVKSHADQASFNSFLLCPCRFYAELFFHCPDFPTGHVSLPKFYPLPMPVCASARQPLEGNCH